MWVVVVESPVKARTVGRVLGRGYRVLACHGHVRDLPAKPDEGFALVYETAGKRAARALGAIRAASRTGTGWCSWWRCADGEWHSKGATSKNF